jgi:hypothetical protein
VLRLASTGLRLVSTSLRLLRLRGPGQYRDREGSCRDANHCSGRSVLGTFAYCASHVRYTKLFTYQGDGDREGHWSVLASHSCCASLNVIRASSAKTTGPMQQIEAPTAASTDPITVFNV